MCSLVEDQDALRHLSCTLRSTISRGRLTVVGSSIVRGNISLWNPPSHRNVVVTTENDLQYAGIDLSNSENIDAGPFFDSLQAVCAANAERLS